MAWEIPIELVSITAGADLSNSQYKAVKIDANGNVVLAGAGENAIGILQNAPEQGKVASVMVLGESKAVYGDTVTAGANLEVDASGRLVPATSGAVVAVARESGNADEIHTVLLVTRTSSGVYIKRSVLSIPVKLANLATGDIVTQFVPGFSGTIEKVSFVVTDPTTDSDADATINLEIGTTDLTGGVVTLADDNANTLGAVIDGTAITGNNAFGNTDAISVEANVTSAFSDGEGVLLIVITG